MTLRRRAAAMLDRVTVEARGVVDDDGAERVRDAVRAALAPRDARFEDDHDPRCLAPARVVRILISDTLCSDADVLTAAPMFDSVDPDLEGDPSSLSHRARSILAEIPRPGAGESMLEQLVCVDAGAAIIAIAERLDQARHLHLRTDLQWESVHASIRAEYSPAARRVSPALGRRLERWADAFERRLLLRRPRSCDG